ncbi:mannitol-1-phosphate 5-dehydrogenase [Scopulibacillus darangshiensis]|uniref:Mannitol-1-phosphate 5-dehydrogenase n=1 Tax=Scopulibacillus darangshiensis TaxID=442528 RepID=A0A4R2P497_9BACL|nr:mannitol-1-phosphate 5-dehydrogenase [Scopulibacillus darangshiensis]TCP28751.1 mannitol-1-phosphate 5-dehydrogenase [Scopulibacillus darangshiensis]
MKNVVHFGAGNIGRGFIGALFSQSGYHVTFVDIADDIITKLNEQGSYNVKTASQPQEVFEINNVSGLNNMTQEDQVVSTIETATFITTAIGPNILPRIAPLIAKGLAKRVKETDDKVYVIACENQISATDRLKEYILTALNKETKAKLQGRVFFSNSAVDRIVPIQDTHDSLDVLVEPYHEWIVEATGSIPFVKGMTTVPDLAPFIERKLFTVNTGHAATAYFGYLAGKTTIDEALNDPAVYDKVKATVEETGAYLVKRYQLDPSEHEIYIEKILERFRNKQLNDSVTRVGRSPIRKLGPEDRLIKPVTEARKLELPYQNLAKAIAACLLFDAEEDPEAVELQRMIRENNVPYVLKSICGLDDNNIINDIVRSYEAFKIK